MWIPVSFLLLGINWEQRQEKGEETPLWYPEWLAGCIHLQTTKKVYLKNVLFKT